MTGDQLRAIAMRPTTWVRPAADAADVAIDAIQLWDVRSGHHGEMSNMPPPPPPPGYSTDSGPTGRADNGMGTASLVLGILSIITGFFFIGIVLGIVGLILGFIGRGRAKRGEATNGGTALAGIITSVIGCLLSIAVIVATVVFLSSSGFGSLVECLEDAGDDDAAVDECERDFEDDLFGS